MLGLLSINYVIHYMGPLQEKKRGEQTTGRLEADGEEVVRKLSGAAEVTRLRNVVEFRFNV